MAKKGSAAGVLTRDNATASTNLTVLRRSDPSVEEVLGTAGHVCLYAFDVDKKEWVSTLLARWQRAPPTDRASRRAARTWRVPCSSYAGATAIHHHVFALVSANHTLAAPSSPSSSSYCSTGSARVSKLALLAPEGALRAPAPTFYAGRFSRRQPGPGPDERV